MLFTPFWSDSSLQGLVRNMEENDVRNYLKELEKYNIWFEKNKKIWSSCRSYGI